VYSRALLTRICCGLFDKGRRSGWRGRGKGSGNKRSTRPIAREKLLAGLAGSRANQRDIILALVSGTVERNLERY